MASWPYTSQRWQRLRRLKLQQNPLCEFCLKQQRIVPAVAVDHIVSIRWGDDAYPPLDGLMSCCESCHNRKTRIVEQQGKKLTVKGCDERGYPLDPNSSLVQGVNPSKDVTAANERTHGPRWAIAPRNFVPPA